MVPQDRRFLFVYLQQGGNCTEIDVMPNATVAEYGSYSTLGDPSGIVHKLQSEIYARGPIATGVNAEPLVHYTGGRVNDTKVRRRTNPMGS